MPRRLLITLNLTHEPHWVHRYPHPIGDRWAAMLLADEEPPPEPGALKGLVFFGRTPEQAELASKAYLGSAEPTN